MYYHKHINENSYDINSQQFQQAVTELTQYVLKQIETEYFKNAVDLQECDKDDISRMIDIADYDWQYIQDGLNEQFSIKECCNEYRHLQLPSVIDSINENWYDIVDENIVDALYDRFDCAGILDKNNYGGGSFEALRELQIAVEEKVTDTIKQMYQINENKNSNMNKKALYERIMSQLSIEVKKVLNEKYSDNLLLYYEIINKLLNREKLSIDEINILENAVAIYRGGGKNKIQKLIKLYIEQAGNNCSLNWIDVSRIKDMSEMFSYSNFNGDISKWDVSNVKIMHNMFEGSKFNGDISKWNVSNVERMDFMFGNSIFNGDISKWDVSNVKNMRYMFWHSQFNGDISDWDVSNVERMDEMFSNSIFNGDISKWNTINVTDMHGMFICSKFNGDISKWNVSNVTDTGFMFAGSKFNRDISKWQLNTQYFNVKNMFDGCPIREKYKPKLPYRIKTPHERWLDDWNPLNAWAPT